MKTLDLDTYLPLKLGNLAERLTATGRAAYAEFELGAGGSRMILVLRARPGSTPAELGRIIAIDKAAVSRTLKILEERGLTTTTLKGKRSRVSLSQSGIELHERLLPVALARQSLLVDGFSVAEVEILMDFIRRMMANLKRGEARTGG